MKERGFTLLELLIVVIILAVLAALLFPSFRAAKEAGLNSEARANVLLIQAAEKMFHMRNGTYIYMVTPNSAPALINANLKLYLQTTTPFEWNYTIGPSGTNGFNVTATRSVSGTTDYDRTLWINSALEEVQCTGFCK